jgi:hypothetical protein
VLERLAPRPPGDHRSQLPLRRLSIVLAGRGLAPPNLGESTGRRSPARSRPALRAALEAMARRRPFARSAEVRVGPAHTPRVAQLARLCRRFADFVELRDRLDPHRRFPRLSRLFRARTPPGFSAQLRDGRE